VVADGTARRALRPGYDHEHGVGSETHLIEASSLIDSMVAHVTLSMYLILRENRALRLRP
jgi:hypothetical protein